MNEETNNAAGAEPQAVEKASEGAANEAVRAPRGEGNAAPSGASAATGSDTPQGANASGQGTAESDAGDQGLLDAESAEKEAAEQKTLGRPESGYKFETKVFDETTAKAFSEVAGELNLSQEAAQEILTRMEPVVAQSVQRNRAQWAQAAHSDSEFGGANFKENMKAVNRAYAATTTPELRQLLKVSGLDSHPEVIRHFYRLSRKLSDGAFITSAGGGRGANGSGSQQDFYKGMNP